MTIITIKVSEKTIWLSIEPMRIYSPENNIIETDNEFICYFKTTEPTPLILGELFRDENRRPIIFSSIVLAKKYAEIELLKKL